MRIVPFVLIALTSSVLADSYSSKTTGLYPSKECKEKGKAGEGQDPVLTCPGHGGFGVEVFFSAENTHVEIKGGSKQLQVGGKKVGNKLEWRFAGGKPFAVIVAVDGKLQIRGLDFHLENTVAEKGEASWKAARDLADTAHKAQATPAPKK